MASKKSVANRSVVWSGTLDNGTGSHVDKRFPKDKSMGMTGGDAKINGQPMNELGDNRRATSSTKQSGIEEFKLKTKIKGV